MTYFVRRTYSGFGGVLEPVAYEPSWDEALPQYLRTQEAVSSYDPNRSLQAQLAETLSLVEDFYAFTPHQRLGSQQYIHGSDIIRSENDRLGREFHLAQFALQALKVEYIQGRLGLKFAESKLCLLGLDAHLGTHVDRIAFHGSPRKLDEIEPRQSKWDDNIGRLYADGGLPNIRASANTKFPSLRANLHNDHDELNGVELILSKRRDQHGRAHWFTSEEALIAIEGTRSYVYGIEPSTVGDHIPTTYDHSRDEYSIYSKRRPLLGVRISPDDLPADLYVIPADYSSALGELNQYDNPRQFCDKAGVPVRPLGGMWPTTDYFPS